MSGGEPTASTAESFYDRQYSQGDYAGYRSAEHHPYGRVVSQFVEANRLRTRRCLEVGCGRGVFQDLVEDYVGVDITDSVRRTFVSRSSSQTPLNCHSTTAVSMPFGQ